jgi:hypothetical protein
MKLLRFKDNTYSWINGDTSPILSETEAVAYGIWKLKVPRHEINLGLTNLKAVGTNSKKDNVAVFGNNNKFYLYTAKVGKDNMNITTLDENGGNDIA